MKLAITADIHFSAYAQDQLIEGRPERLNSLYKTLNNMVSECKKQDVNTICLAGDLLHNKSIIHTTGQDRLLAFIEEHQDIHFYAIDGNHDLSGKGTDSVSALKSLEPYKHVTWVSHQSKGQKYKYIDDGRVALLPYYPGMQESIKEIKSDILISHFGLSEAMLSSGISIQSNIKASDLKRFKLVVLGHYHLPQAMVSGKTHMYYTGSPIQLDWGEKNEEKRFLIIDTKDPHNVESIPTLGYMKYLEFKLDAKNKSEKIEEAKSLRNDGHHVKLVTTEKLEVTEDMKDIGIVSNVEEDITNRGITSDMDEMQLHGKYLEIKEIPEDEHEAYLNTAKRIIDATELPE